MTTVLVVDDEKLLVKGLKRSLEQAGYSVLTAHDGRECLNVVEKEAVDIILLDLMLPGIDGLEVCRILPKNNEIPIIMLTARGEDVDKIVGLELGADDYVTKPFNSREPLARIKAVLRRYNVVKKEKEDVVLRTGELQIDGPKRKVYKGKEEVELTAREFDLLFLLAGHPSRVFTRGNLLDIVWGSSHYSGSRSVGYCKTRSPTSWRVN